MAIAGPILIVCAIVAVLAAFDYSMNSGQIYRGVSAGSVDLGGMTPAQAEAAIREEATGALQEVNFTGPEEYTFSAEEMGIDYDIAATVEEAYGVGREGGVFARISDRFQGMYGNLSVEPDVDFEPERSRSQVESVASELNAEGIGFSLFEMPALAALVHRIIAEEHEKRSLLTPPSVVRAPVGGSLAAMSVEPGTELQPAAAVSLAGATVGA